MDRKELEQQMRADVKPGTESIAINEAQTAANQLLTEQRMNNESARAIMTSNSERDTELRGAIELGAMAQPQQAQVVQQLPVQAAALRPETQQLLAKYGVNPQVTERSRSSSNNTQTRSTNSVRKDIPNPQGGRTTVTNTTNITNITNNSTKTETDIDMPAPQSTPAPVQRVVQPVAVAQGGDGKFKAFLNNLFAKRDLERRGQEKEFRKRDWEIQRMTRKVMDRMEKISTTFAKKMNPENVGRTYGSQIKMMLTMAGLTLLPKLFPKMISGLNVVGDAVMKGVDFIKTTFSSADGNVFEKLGTTITKSTKALGEKIDTSIGEWILAGLDKSIADANGNGKVGIVEALSTKLALMLGGDVKAGEKGGKQTLGGVLGNVFNELKDYIKDMFNLQMEDRAKALDKVWSESKFSATGWADNLSNLAKLIGAAVGGTRFLERSALNNMTKDAKEAAFKGLSDDDKGFFGGIATHKGATKVMKNLGELSTDNDVSNATAIAEGTKNLYEYYTDKGYDMTIKEDDFWNIVKRVNTPDDAKKIETLINTALKNKTIIKRPIGNYRIKEGNDRGQAVDSVAYNSGKYQYEIPKEYLPTIFSMMNGLRLEDGYGFDEASLARSKKNLESIYDDANLYREHLRYIDAIASSNLKGQSIDWSALVGNVVKGIGDLLVWDGIHETKYDQVYYDHNKGEGSDFERHGINEAEKATEDLRKKEDKINSKLSSGQTAVSVDAVGKAAKELPGKMKESAINLGNQAWDATKGARQFVADTYDYATRGADMTGHGQHDSNYTNGWYAGGQTQTATRAPQTQAKTIDKETWIANRVKELENSNLPIDRNPENLRKAAEEDYNKASKRNRTPLEQRIQYVMDFLQANGFTAEQAAGMTGVLIAESNLDPTAINKMEEKKFGFHKAGKGIAQWSNSRNDDFINWYKANYGEDGVYPNQASMEAQLKFMLYEMAGRTAFMDAMKKVNHPDQAADIMLRGYENGSDTALASPSQIDKIYSKYNNGYEKQYLTRVGHARDVYALYTGNYLTGPIDTALLKGNSYNGEDAKKADYGTIGNVFSGLIDTFNTMFGSDGTSYESTEPRVDTVDGGSLSKYTETAKADEDNTIYEASLPEVTVTASKVQADPISTAAKGVQQTAEKPQAQSSESSETTAENNPIMMNTGGNVTNSGNVTNENVTINHYGRSTRDDVSYSFTGTRSRDYANR